MAILTDRDLIAVEIAEDDVLHLVDVSDTSENAAGSSFKVKKSQVSTQSFADSAARAAATPGFVGQLAVQEDTGVMYRGTAFSAGSWTAVADFILETSTTDATQTEMSVADGGSEYFEIASGENTTFEILINANQTGGSSGSAGDSWGAVYMGQVKNVGGTPSIVGSIGTIWQDSDTAAAAWSVAIDIVGGTPDRLRIRVTGEANKNIDWKAKIISTPKS